MGRVELMSDEDDWLWECALNQHEESLTAAAQTKFLVPEWEEEAHHFVPSKGHQRHHTARVYPSGRNDITDIVIKRLMPQTLNPTGGAPAAKPVLKK